MSVKPDDHWMAPVHDMNRDAALDFLGAYMLQVMGKSAHRYRERADELEQEAANLRAAASELDERIKERMANGLEETLSRMRAEAIERGDHREPKGEVTGGK